MKMGRRPLSRVDQGVQALDRQAGAAEPEQRVGRREQPEGGDKGVTLHIDYQLSGLKIVVTMEGSRKWRLRGAGGEFAVVMTVCGHGDPLPANSCRVI
jgi:hypothetical protein